MSYDFVILGAGAAGFAAAMRADSLKAITALINAGLPTGGTCVNVGCVPSKHLLELGHDLFYPGSPRFSSLSPADILMDFPQAMKEKEGLVASLRKSNYADVLQELDHVDHIEGHASFRANTEVEVDGRRIEGRRCLLATGSTIRIPPISGLEELDYLTNESILALPSVPKSLLVLGGGPLGLEFA